PVQHHRRIGDAVVQQFLGTLGGGGLTAVPDDDHAEPVPVGHLLDLGDGGEGPRVHRRVGGDRDQPGASALQHPPGAVRSVTQVGHRLADPFGHVGGGGIAAVATPAHDVRDGRHRHSSQRGNVPLGGSTGTSGHGYLPSLFSNAT